MCVIKWILVQVFLLENIMSKCGTAQDKADVINGVESGRFIRSSRYCGLMAW